MGRHVADVMLDLAVAEHLETEFMMRSRSAEEDVALAEYVKTGHAIPSQTDAGAHLNTNFCTAGESSYVLGEWVRERGCSRWRTRSGASPSSPRASWGCPTAGSSARAWSPISWCSIPSASA